jgi:hypothetical protein
VTRRGVGYRFGQWCCYAIALETVGGVAYYAVLAGQILSVLLLTALGIGARYGIHRISRRR